ncbi:hypothetical protein [Mucilaginibacter sp.]|uniref:hypothetical protein n=1 Tax=Mucilaginibacter sp. TaxID=1882438 RepID=UPI0035BBBF4D
MKKYILTAGRHQFIPNSPAVHTNDNLTDEEAEWYLQRYPHIAKLFIDGLQGAKPDNANDVDSIKQKIKRKRISKPVELVKIPKSI